MPFRDHFRPPVSKRHSWEEVHSGWPMMMIQKLAPLLPEGYQAGPRVHLGSYFEVDIATFENDDAPRALPQVAGDGGVATVPEAELSLETDSSDVSEYEVLVYDVQQEKRLVAAIEIISPANKDRPLHRLETKTVYDIWRKPLILGTPLPTLPLWLADKLSIPLDLEASYEDTCRLLRIV